MPQPSHIHPDRLFDRETQCMAQFAVYYPDVIVQGAWILAYFSVFGDIIAPIAARAGLGDVQPDEWYPQQPFLDVLEQSCDQMPAGLFEAGLRLGDKIQFDEEPRSVAAMLSLLENQYHLHHRNDDRSHWRVTVDHYHLITCTSSTPYPSDVERGVVSALVMRFRDIAGTCRIWRDQDEPTRKAGADSCTYRILWSEDQPREASREAARSASAG